MTDLVVTIPRERWTGFITHSTGANCSRSYDFYGERPPLVEGDWLFFLSHRRIRAAIAVHRVMPMGPITRAVGAFKPAITVAESRQGFKGWQRAWFSMRDVVEFSEWRTKGVWLPPSPAEDALAHGKTAAEHAGSSA